MVFPLWQTSFLLNPEFINQPGLCRITWYGVRNMNNCQLTLAITALANAMTKNLSPEEAALLGSLLTQLGDTILTIAAQQSLCSK